MFFFFRTRGRVPRFRPRLKTPSQVAQTNGGKITAPLVLAFVAGFVLVIWGLGALAPHPLSRPVPLSTIPDHFTSSGTPCGIMAHVVSARLVDNADPAYPLYAIRCSNNMRLEVSVPTDPGVWP